MADLRIVDAPVLLQESITDDVKMPTGGLGNFSVRLGDILWYVITKEQLANKNYVDLSSKSVKDSLDEHIADKANPHQVTKEQVGLGSVDNTADIDKPVSNATKSAIITATTDMATKAYVNQKDNLKADKATTLSGYGITDAYTKDETYSRVEINSALTLKSDVAYVDGKDGDLTTLTTNDKTNLVRAVNEIHDVTKGVVALYDKNVEAAAGAGVNGWTDLLIRTKYNRTLQSKLGEFISVKDFGAIADGTLHPVSEWTVVGSRIYYENLVAIQKDYPHVTALTDSIDWAATVKAFGVSNVVNFGDDKNHYVVNKTAFTNDNQKIIGNFATIRQTKADTQIFDASNKTNNYFSGIKFVGMGTADFANSAGSRSDGIYAYSANGLTVENCLFEGLSHSSLTCVKTSNVKFTNNKVLGLGAANLTDIDSHSNVGLVIDRESSNVIVSSNTMTDLAMGMQTGNLCSNVRIEKNFIARIKGQHAFYLGASQTNVSVVSNQVDTTSLSGIKIQTYDEESIDSVNVVIANNAVLNAGADGILVDSTSPAHVYNTADVTITGNTVRNSGQNGINARYLRKGVIADNIVDIAVRDGIAYDGAIDVLIDNNIISKAGNNGIAEFMVSTRCTVSNNKVINCAVNNTSGNRFGIFIPTNATELTLKDNTITDTYSKMQYGVFFESGDIATISVVGNTVTGATDAGLRKVATNVPFKYYANNIFEGALGSTIGVNSIPYQMGNTGRVFFASSMPSSGSFIQGDYVNNIAPSISDNSVVVGWLRITTGSNHVLNTDWVAIKQSTV